jgi:hypothetical protein
MKTGLQMPEDEETLRVLSSWKSEETILREMTYLIF